DNASSSDEKILFDILAAFNFCFLTEKQNEAIAAKKCTLRGDLSRFGKYQVLAEEVNRRISSGHTLATGHPFECAIHELQGHMSHEQYVECLKKPVEDTSAKEIAK